MPTPDAPSSETETETDLANAADAALAARWKDEPAPLLPLLHAFHDRDGFLSETALRTVSNALGIPIAELFGTVTFYHHFALEPGGKERPRVCTGNVCCLNGGRELLAELESEGATPMPCAGRCDSMVPVIRGDQVLTGHSAGALAAGPTPLPPPNPGGIEECCFRHIRTPGRASIDGYRATGGYAALDRAMAEQSPEEVIETITRSGLAGRGGAGFPTGAKWKAVHEAPGHPKAIVCNADEGEPGCFKDRALLDHDPHALLEGMAAAAYATGATLGFIYLRYEYPETATIVQRAIDEAESAGVFPGKFKVYLRRGAGAYVCGEEGSLLNSLEGKHPFPRNKPPFPTTHGFENRPTVVNNVETLCSVPHILEHGADWYRELGLGDHPGTKLVSLSGDIRRPGNYEIPIGLPLHTLLHEWAGGPRDGRTFQAVTMAGLSGGFIGGSDLDDLTLDEPSTRSKGSFLGAAGIIVFDDSRDMVAAAREAMAFFAHESCGKCFPCRIGTQRLTERLTPGGTALTGPDWSSEVDDIGDTMAATSACGLGMAAPNVTRSLQKYFGETVAEKLGAR